MNAEYVLYYLLPNRRMAVVRDFHGIVLSFTNEELAKSYAHIISAQQTYYLDYPIAIHQGHDLDNTVDGISRTESDETNGERYGYPLGRTPRGLCPIGVTYVRF